MQIIANCWLPDPLQKLTCTTVLVIHVYGKKISINFLFIIIVIIMWVKEKFSTFIKNRTQIHGLCGSEKNT